jgi:hypothetical protein
MADNSSPLVGILMGSKSDWETMQAAAKILEEFGVPYDAKVASAHRSPDLVTEFVGNAEKRGIKVMIAAAGLAAHLPGVVAAQTLLPVLGVPMLWAVWMRCFRSHRCRAACRWGRSQLDRTVLRTQRCSRFGFSPRRSPNCAKSLWSITRRWPTK